MSIQTARRTVKEHTGAAELTGSYRDHLKSAGARRGLGDQVYGEKAELVQEILWHKSIETTHRAYRERPTAQPNEDIENVLYNDQQRLSVNTPSS